MMTRKGDDVRRPRRAAWTSRATPMRRFSSPIHADTLERRRRRQRLDRLHRLRPRLGRRSRADRRARKRRRPRTPRREGGQGRSGGRRHPFRPASGARRAPMPICFRTAGRPACAARPGSTTIPSARRASSCSRRRNFLRCWSNSAISPTRRMSQRSNLPEWRDKDRRRDDEGDRRVFRRARRRAVAEGVGAVPGVALGMRVGPPCQAVARKRIPLDGVARRRLVDSATAVPDPDHRFALLADRIGGRRRSRASERVRTVRPDRFRKRLLGADLTPTAIGTELVSSPWRARRRALG